MKQLIASLGFTFLLSILQINIFAQVKDVDGNTYKTVKIGAQTWMAENLNVSHFNNGDAITEENTKEDWVTEGYKEKPMWCSYYSNPKEAVKYGKLYNSYVVIDPRGLAPKGWHIPSQEEWQTLINFLGGVKIASAKMKSTTGWNKNGNNSSGFNGFASPTRNQAGLFSYGPYTADWWSTDNESTPGGIYYTGCMLNDAGDRMEGEYFEMDAVAVRCIKDELKSDIEEPDSIDESYSFESESAGDFILRAGEKMDAKDYTGAIADYNKAINIVPEDAELYYYRGGAKDQLKDYKDAITDYTRAIKLKPRDPNFYYSRAISKYFLKDYAGSIADCSKAIEIKPKNADAYYFRGLAKHSSGLKDGGCSDFKKAVELGDKDAKEALKEFCK